MRHLQLRYLILISFAAVVFLSQPINASPTDLYLKNTATYNSGRYLWTIYVAGDPAAIDDISYVEYTLHYSFPKPVQVIRERGTKCPFALSSNSWGEFEIKARIVLKSGHERTIKYWLNLLDNKVQGSACSSSQNTRPKKLRVRQVRN
jgi:transcription initiation factor IIF auxiliary subunit